MALDVKYKEKHTPLVMDNSYFVLSLIFVGLGGLTGVLLLPFLFIMFLLWYYFRNDKLKGAINEI